jgi:hypothetical protein
MTKDHLDAVLASHEAWLKGKEGQRADLTGADLTRAILTGARLTDAILTDAILTGARLTDASLIGADLRGADLTRAILTGARLADAILTGARLTDVILTGVQIKGQTVVSLLRRATRSDGYEFFLWHCKEGFFVGAGCRFMGMKEARKHWAETRGGTPLGDETMDILRFFAAAIKRAAP